MTEYTYTDSDSNTTALTQITSLEQFNQFLVQAKENYDENITFLPLNRRGVLEFSHNESLRKNSDYIKIFDKVLLKGILLETFRSSDDEAKYELITRLRRINDENFYDMIAQQNINIIIDELASENPNFADFLDRQTKLEALYVLSNDHNLHKQISNDKSVFEVNANDDEKKIYLLSLIAGKETNNPKDAMLILNSAIDKDLQKDFPVRTILTNYANNVKNSWDMPDLADTLDKLYKKEGS